MVGGQEAVESDEGCTRPIDTFHAAQALKALRIVSKGESPRFQVSAYCYFVVKSVVMHDRALLKAVEIQKLLKLLRITS